MNDERPGRVAVVWRGDAETRRNATVRNNRYVDVFAALREVGLEPEPAVYSEEQQNEVRAQLLRVDGVLVWVNPLSDGRDRTALDELLREVAGRGVWVTAHPDVILGMGTKEVLVRTRSLGWGSDCQSYATASELEEQLSRRLASGAVRVLKRNRGNGGEGVWKVEAAVPAYEAGTTPARLGPETVVDVFHAKRGSLPQRIRFSEFLRICAPFFEHGGRVVDQAFQPRLPEGMIRCYMVKDRVAGFGQQRIQALVPPPPEGPDSEAAQPGPRIMHGADAADFQRLRAAMEGEWVPSMQELLGIPTEQLPVIWDADFLYGPKTASGEDTYVLCEINVSCVFAFPDHALQPLAAATVEAVRSSREKRMRLASG